MKRWLIPYLVAGLLLISCQANPTAPPTATTAPPTATTASPTATLTTQDIVIARAKEAVQALRNRDMEKLASLVHPKKGVRFSPYAFVRDSDLVFMPDQLIGILSDPTKYTWGFYDGSGLPIEMTFQEYYERFVYDQDYANAERTGYDERIGQGNTIDNALTYYSGGHMVEYHFSGFDPAFGGMDWRSLRLVFQEEGSEWYLVGIIHDEWTS